MYINLYYSVVYIHKVEEMVGRTTFQNVVSKAQQRQHVVSIDRLFRVRLTNEVFCVNIECLDQ